MFKTLTETEKFLTSEFYRGGNQDSISFLSTKDPDPRIFAIKYWDWIRTVENKFYAWQWDLKTLERLINSTDFWKKVRVKNTTWIELYEVRTTKELSGKYEALCDEWKVLVDARGIV